MGAEDVSTRIGKQSEPRVHPFHVERIVKHAIRNIKGAPALANKIFGASKRFRKQLPIDRNDRDNNLKHYWN